jgi:hypothetical protein
MYLRLRTSDTINIDELDILIAIVYLWYEKKGRRICNQQMEEDW